MKKLLLLFILFSLTGCASAQVDQKPLYRVVAFVQDKGKETARLQPDDSSVSYLVPSGEFENEKEYVFYLEITDCGDCRTRKAIVVDHAITTGQAQRDQEASARELSNRKIIK